MSKVFFVASALTPDQAEIAFPLVALAAPAIGQERWLDFARRMAGEPRERAGLIALRNRRGYVLGLFSYRVCEDLALGRTLVLSDLLMVRLFETALFDKALETSERLAGEFRCESIAVETSRPLAPSCQLRLGSPLAKRYRIEAGPAAAAGLPAALQPCPEADGEGTT